MRALVMSGGGVKGAFQLGVLKHWMHDLQRDYEIVCGVSVGAINAACVSMVPFGKPKEAWETLNGLWARCDNSKIRKSWPIFGLAAALWKTSGFDSTPLQKWIHAELDVPKIKASGRKVRVGAVCWEDGEYKFGTEQDDKLADWVLASSSFPGMFAPVLLEGKLWTDGGVKNVTPLGEAIRLGATEIDVILCDNPELASTWSPKNKAVLPGYAVRAIDLMGTAVIMADLKICGLKNDLAALDERYKHVKINLMMPQVKLCEDPLDFDPVKIKGMIEVGYKQASLV